MTKLSEWKQKMLEEQFFRPKWYSVFLNPYFINRRGIFKAIKGFADATEASAKVLDVGCGIKPYRKLFATKEYIGIDIEDGGHANEAKAADTYYDGINIPFDNNSFDTLICTQVLEHAEEPESLIKECYRVMRSGGRLFVSMPFIYPEHEKPYDFRRFTSFQHKKILEKNGFFDIKIVQTTGFFGTFGQLFVVFLFESITFRASVLKTILSIFIFGPIQIISLLLDLLFQKSGPTMDYIVTAKKK